MLLVAALIPPMEQVAYFQGYRYTLPTFGKGQGRIFFTKRHDVGKNPTPALPEVGEGELSLALRALLREEAGDGGT
jgi:hypothetical protein